LDLKLLAQTEEIFRLVSDIQTFQQTTILKTLEKKLFSWTNQNSAYTICDLFLTNLKNINVYDIYVESFNLFSSLFEKLNENVQFRDTIKEIDLEVGINFNIFTSKRSIYLFF